MVGDLVPRGVINVREFLWRVDLLAFRSLYGIHAPRFATETMVLFILSGGCGAMLWSPARWRSRARDESDMRSPPY
jgi:hypothetical protein